LKNQGLKIFQPVHSSEKENPTAITETVPPSPPENPQTVFLQKIRNFFLGLRLDTYNVRIQKIQYF